MKDKFKLCCYIIYYIFLKGVGDDFYGVYSYLSQRELL